MTVSTSTARDQQLGNGTVGPFTVPFRVLDATHLQILMTVAGVTTTKVLTTDYTVGNVGAANASVLFTAITPVNALITFLRNVPITQETDYVPNDPFPAESHERALDKLTMVEQQTREITARSLTLPPEVVGASAQLPAPVALNLIGWDAGAGAMRNFTTSDLTAMLGGAPAGPPLASAIVYTQGGTGSSSTNIEAKLRQVVSFWDFINPSEWAAIQAGTSVADLTADFAEALASFGACGGVLDVPAGTYIIGQQSSMPSKVWVRGAGLGATIFKAPTGIPEINTWFAALEGTTDLRISGITFDGTNRVFYRWLTNPDTRAAITDPQEDYFANGGKIGDPAFPAAISGVCLTQSRGSAGNLVINGTLSSGGSVNLATAIRRITITSTGANNESGVTFTVTGTDFNNAALVVAVAGPTAGATVRVGTTAFKTVTQVAVNAATVGSVQVGVDAFDIFGTASEGRRDARYSTSGSAFSLRQNVRTVIENCKFVNHKSTVIRDLGSLDTLIQECEFSACGKNDGPFPAIYAQDLGGVPTKNIRVLRNRFLNLERLAALFNPTAGGDFIGNYCHSCGEAMVFITSTANSAGGVIRIKDNWFGPTVLTDITAAHIEAGNAANVQVEGNFFLKSATSSLIMTGTTNVSVRDNLFSECVDYVGNYPYGPFSERHGFNEGSAPIAGTAVPLGGVIMIGSLGASGGRNVVFRHNTFSDPVASNQPTGVFKQTKAGFNDIGGDVLIADNDCTNLHSGIPLLDTGITGVWVPNKSPTIRNNRGHVSDAPVAVFRAYNATGNNSIVCGFRPRHVLVYAASNDPALHRTCVGALAWQVDGTSAAQAVLEAVPPAAATVHGFSSAAFLNLRNSSGAAVFAASLVSWDELGFTVNVSNASTPCDVRFVCFP